MKSETHKTSLKSQPNRREYFRLDYRRPVKFRMLEDESSEDADLRLGTSANISETGILFSSPILPKIASLLWMDIDLRTLKICKEIEKHAVVYRKGLLGRVVRLEEDPTTDSYNVGVCFVTQDTSNQELKF